MFKTNYAQENIYCWKRNARNGWEYYKKHPFADVPQNMCSQKFRYIHKKRPVLESLFNRNSNTGLSLHCKIFKNSFFYRIPPMVASGVNETSFRVTFKLEKFPSVLKGSYSF